MIQLKHLKHLKPLKSKITPSFRFRPRGREKNATVKIDTKCDREIFTLSKNRLIENKKKLLNHKKKLLENKKKMIEEKRKMIESRNKQFNERKLQQSSGKNSNSKGSSKKRGFISKVKKPFKFLLSGLQDRILFERKNHRQNSSSDGWTVSSSQDNDEEIQRRIEEASELDQAGNNLIQQGKHDDALKAYILALKYKDLMLKTSIVSDDNAGENSSENSSPAISIRMKDQLLASVATSINNIGYLRQHLGDTSSDEIMSAYQDSLRIKKKILGESDLSIGTTLNNIGSVYFSNEDHKEAMNSYQQALDIMVDHLGTFHLDVATVQSNIGDVYAATDEFELARMYYDQALEVRWSEIGNNDPKTTRLLERIAAIDMAETTKNLIERPETVYERKTSEQYCPPPDTYTTLADDIFENVLSMEESENSLEIEMFRDKIEMICGMREFK